MARRQTWQLLQVDERRAPTSGVFRCVSESGHQGRTRQDSPDYLPLYADAFAVNDPQRLQSYRGCGLEVSFDRGLDVAWGKGMQIEFSGDGDADRLFGIHAAPP